MPLIKKCDVNDYFAARRRARANFLNSAGQAKAAVPSVRKPGAIRANPSMIAGDFVAEHASADKYISPNADPSGSTTA